MTAATALSTNAKPGVEYFPTSKPWRMDGERLHLQGMSCSQCGTKAFPLREVCSACGSDQVGPVELAATGKLYSFSEVHVAPKGFAVPYVVAYVDLDDGVRLFGQVEGPADKLALDQRVAVVSGTIRTRNDGTPVVSYKFKGQSA
jgi:benzoylsuccinyl-CoA thiolase BbsA subunit